MAAIGNASIRTLARLVTFLNVYGLNQNS